MAAILGVRCNHILAEAPSHHVSHARLIDPDGGLNNSIFKFYWPVPVHHNRQGERTVYVH